MKNVIAYLITDLPLALSGSEIFYEGAFSFGEEADCVLIPEPSGLRSLMSRREESSESRHALLLSTLLSSLPSLSLSQVSVYS